MTSSRVLAWDGCVNVRDLGGLPLAGGGQTRFGAIVRADSIRGLSDEGWRTLVDYGIRRAIDLRDDPEAVDDPPHELPIDVVRVPIRPRLVPEAATWPSMLEAYRALLGRFQGEFARAVVAIAESDEPVVVHCAGGRDRTGLTVALVLSAAGVAPEAIAADHAESDASWAPHNEDWFARAPDERERARRRRIAVPAGETMIEVLDEIGRRWGGARGYLEAGGASPANIDTVVVRLRP